MTISKILLSICVAASVTGSAHAGAFKATFAATPSKAPASSMVHQVSGNWSGVSEVFHSGGRFIKNGNRWTERGNNGAQFNFIETGRDNSSIYLRDNSRGVNLRLDLNTYQIFYSDDSGANFLLYNISSVTNSNSNQGQIGSAVWSEQYTCNEGIPLVLDFEQRGNDLWVSWTHDGYRSPNKLPQVISGSGNRFSDGRSEVQTKGRTAVVFLDGINDVCTRL